MDGVKGASNGRSVRVKEARERAQHNSIAACWAHRAKGIKYAQNVE